RFPVDKWYNGGFGLVRSQTLFRYPLHRQESVFVCLVNVKTNDVKSDPKKTAKESRVL
uniref:Uncharacterized protein n=1 Tax=Anopheles quadriannulatus TaxID=34691 RepID=A0A182XRK3_ANOQN